jgi:hypothetical protein
MFLSPPEALVKFRRSNPVLPLSPTPLPVTPEALAKFHGLLQLMLGQILFLPLEFLPFQITPEAMSNVHRGIQLMTTLGYWVRE